MSRLSDLFASLVPSGQQVSEMSNAEIAAVLKTARTNWIPQLEI